MFHTRNSSQNAAEFVLLDQLVEEDHLLRKIDKYIDFSFIIEKVKPYYSENKGRPSLDPLILFKMMFIGYLYGIRSERQLEKEIYYNMAYRWFLGLNINDPVPHHSTISWNRRTRFKDTTIFQDIFDEIVLQAINHDMVGGRVLFTDSTHLKANANKHKYTRRTIEQDTQNYIKDLNEAIQEDREEHGKKPLTIKEEVKAEKEIRHSTTDPESGYLYRENKPEGFFYLDHRTTDMKYNIITDAYVTPGNVHDSVPYLDRLDHQIARFGFQVEAVALDSGYLTTPICKGLSDRHILASLPTDDITLLEACFQNGNFNMTVNKTGTFARTSKHSHTQQLIVKDIGHINQVLKHVPHALFLKTVQSRKNIRKSSPGMYGKTTKKRSGKIA